MAAYYNEWDAYAAQWLRNLIAAGHLPAGDVDERSIVDVRADDLRGYTQVHFFAGIGGWSRALRLAGWPDDRPVWTGSCPCQPFSAAGKRKGVEDERHLWPEFRRLIAECDPAVVFGEQVASKDGRLWLAGVRADLEALGYAVGAADLCAASCGAPHIRQRLWWVADSNEGERRRLSDGEGRQHDGSAAGRIESDGVAQSGGAGGRLADSDGGLAGHGHLQPGGEYGQQPQDGGAVERVADTERHPGRTGRPGQQPGGSVEAPPTGPHAEPGRRSDAGRLGHADNARPQGRGGNLGAERPGERAAGPAGASFWGSAEWLACADGKSRRTQPGVFPLAHGIPARVGKLRAAGNAIVPQVAAEFIGAWLESTRAS